MNNEINKPLEAMRRNAMQAESMLKSLANAKRLLILCHLIKQKHTVGELVDLVGLSQSALSQHLGKMRLAGLVAARKNGKLVYYQIASHEVEAILSTLYLIYCKD